MAVRNGWTDDWEVREAFRGYFDAPAANPEQTCVGFRRFSHLPFPRVRMLSLVMPPANWEDRQNLAPTCADFIEAARRFPMHVSLGGYVVGAPRRDERVTFDSVWVASRVLTDSEKTSRAAAAGWFERVFPGAARAEPDEVTVDTGMGATGFVRLWWD